ncbi:MAG: hydrolase, partial [Gammaproteobacteria bacterium]|nr:hydrolase [Gammaproteobacteria bacterium]
REIKAELRLAATNNTWSAVAAVDRLYHAAGGSSVYATSDLQRCFRDVHVATQHIMVAQPTYEVVGKVALGIDPKTLL